MNNPVDISRMYGLNNTATHTINSQNMHHKMQKLPPRATEEMNKKNASMVKEDAVGVYKKFRLIDDDVWIMLADEYSKYFKL